MHIDDMVHNLGDLPRSNHLQAREEFQGTVFFEVLVISTGKCHVLVLTYTNNAITSNCDEHKMLSPDITEKTFSSILSIFRSSQC